MSYIRNAILLSCAFSYSLFSYEPVKLDRDNERVFKYNEKWDARGNSTEKYASRGAKLFISSDKKRFTKNEKLNITLSIKNTGVYPMTFYIHKNYFRNFTIIARDQHGSAISMKDITKFKHHNEYKDNFHRKYTATTYHSRTITLQPNESFTRQMNLRDVLDLSRLTSEENRITLRAYFYPNPLQNLDEKISSVNRHSLYLDFNKNNLQKAHPMRLKSVSISPKEIVYLALSAEYTKNWPDFFKYISLTELIRDYPEFARRYVHSSDQSRASVLQEFRKYLSDRKTHKLIKFRVGSEKIEMQTKEIAEVKVNAMRNVEGFDREFNYTFYLTKADKMWNITGIDAQLIK